MTGECVQVVFKINGLPLSIKDALNDERGLQLGIVGSMPEFGSWQPRNMLPAEPCPAEENMWTVTAQLPMSTAFKWTWIVTASDARVLYSDPAGNKPTFLNYFTGIVETTWGVTEARFIPQTSAVKMRVHYHCHQGEVLAIVGSGHSLGSWDPKKAIRAKESPANSNNWIAEALLDKSIGGHEWKWVVINSESGNVKRWEERENRHLGYDSERLQMIDTRWNCKSVFHHQGVILALNSNEDMANQDVGENDQNTSTASNYVPVNWLNNANTLELPFELTDTDLARMEAAAREMEPKWQKFVRRVSALLPFVYNWCRVYI